MKIHNKTKLVILYMGIVIYIILMNSPLGYLYDIKVKTYNNNPYYYGTIFISMTFGLLIGLENMLKECYKQGKWKINILKVVLLGIPSIFLTFFKLIYEYITIDILILHKLYILNNNIYIYTSFLLGYVLITSIYKDT